jgi:hypothetical protein
MSDIFIRFGLDLEDYSDPSPLRNHGPQFHRWLPNGEADAVQLQIGHPRYALKVWFERRGFVRDGWIEYDDDRDEIDEALLDQQGALDAGPLSGLLKVVDPPEPAIAAIRAGALGDSAYLEFARHIVQEILQPQVSYFLDTLRVRLGQHWIQPLEPWDSRRQTLGSYCLHLNMRWSEAASGPWQPLRPEKPVSFAQITAVGEYHFRDLITRDDWFAFDGMAPGETPITLGETILMRAHAMLNHGEHRFALVEATTALEVAISERFRRRFQGSEILAVSASGFHGLSLGARLLALVPDPSDHISDLELALEAIDHRHQIVHEGKSPPENSDRLVRSLLAVTALLLPLEEYRFPSSRRGNALAPSEKWQEIYAARGFEPLSQDSPDA